MRRPILPREMVIDDTQTGDGAFVLRPVDVFIPIALDINLAGGLQEGKRPADLC